MREVCLALCFVLLACGGTRPLSPTSTLRAPETLLYNFMARQELVFTSDRGAAHSFQTVLQKRGNTLTLLALTPFGTRAFSIEQTGSVVHASAFDGRELPVSPDVIMADVNRCVLPYFDGDAAADGTRRTRIRDVYIDERWDQHRLVERRFHESRETSDNDVVVEYEHSDAMPHIASRTRLRNPDMHYRIEVVTIEFTALEAEAVTRDGDGVR